MGAGHARTEPEPALSRSLVPVVRASWPSLRGPSPSPAPRPAHEINSRLNCVYAPWPPREPGKQGLTYPAGARAGVTSAIQLFSPRFPARSGNRAGVLPWRTS